MDGIETEYGDRLHVIRLNAQDEVGRELATVYGFNFTPTFVLFDGEGNELWREVGGLDTQRVHDSVK